MFSKSGSNVVFYSSNELTKAGFVNIFSTRLGGVSALPKDDLNLAYQDDTGPNVSENRRRLTQEANLSPFKFFTAKQTHSSQVKWVDENVLRLPGEPSADALISPLGDVLLGIKTADCLPILIADPETKVIAAIHAGWRGTFGRIAQNTAAELENRGVNLFKCLVAFGPTLCLDCFEVGEEVQQVFNNDFEESASLFFKRSPTTGETWLKPHFNLVEANRVQLLQKGFNQHNIHVLPYCTAHDLGQFFSYRKESQNGKKPVGRMLSLIGFSSR